jgi:hypothetical protein
VDKKLFEFFIRPPPLTPHASAASPEIILISNCKKLKLYFILYKNWSGVWGDSSQVIH